LTKLITLTPNPTIDLSTSVDKLMPFAKLRCRPERRDPGGGGINVARVVKRLGGDALAIYPAGGPNGQLLQRLMDHAGVPGQAVAISGDTREDFTVFEEASGRQFRFVLPGASLYEQEWNECLRVLVTSASQTEYVVASGSLPPGAPLDFYASVAEICRKLGAKCVLDASGPPLKAAVEQGVYLIKPNLREFQELTGAASDDETDLTHAGRSLIGRGLVEVVALTLGDRGALVMTSDRTLRVEGLSIKPASVVGAGDSFLGAMIWRLTIGHDLIDALRYAVAAGSAALLNPGTELCRREDVLRLVAEVKITSK
jgi:6-phosphofructokinase 2